MIQGGKIPSEVANKEMIELNNRARQIQRKIQEIANALAQTTGMITKVISKEEEDLAKELSVVEQELIDAKKEEKQATDLVNKTKKSLSQLFRDWKLARNRLLKAEQLHDIETIRSAEKEINDIINEIKNEKKELKYYEFLRRYATANFGRAQDKKRLIEKMLAILKQMDREAKQRLLITWREGMRTGNFQPFISELRKVERELIEEERLIDQERKNLRRSERTTLKEEYGTKQAERATSADIVRDRKIEFE